MKQTQLNNYLYISKNQYKCKEQIWNGTSSFFSDGQKTKKSVPNNAASMVAKRNQEIDSAIPTPS